eukprot:TRINITY_DN46963_c0_g1_i1.p1 TRINITY_DN46963_c0_g1~~TRINITY_DN46963_c0_g1_i1.p1  ORF type:complete len:125 (+),score=27.61 TRINITY_DN46963_c0_g1_i1:95-469(+)
MHFASGARFARCRSSHLSYFARRSNAAAFQVHRGIATAALSRVCVEAMPPAGFPEQRISAVVTGAPAAAGEAEGPEAAETHDVLAALIDGAIAESSGVSHSIATSCKVFMISSDNQNRRPLMSC